MLYRGGIALLFLAGCQFRPEGGELADDDVIPSVDAAGDDGAAADASTVDAPAATIDAPIDARPACPAAYSTVVANVRYVRRGPASINGARSDCNDDLPGRTRLATFPVPGTMEQVFDAVLDNGDQPWVGARCEFGPLGCSGAGAWSWDTSEAIDGGLWRSGEPNNGITELNAAAARPNDAWELYSVDSIFPFEGRRYVCACSE